MGRNDEPNDLFPVCVACLQTFPKILTVQHTLIIFRGVTVNVVFIYFFNMCVVLSFSIVQVLRFHCKDRLLLCAGSWGWSGLDLEVFLRRECGVCLSRGRRQHLPTPPPSVIFDPALKLKLYSSTPTLRTEAKMETTSEVAVMMFCDMV